VRESVAAAALIREDRGGDTWWLARWSRSWQCYHLVGGHKHDDESFRQCLVREIGEELGLQEHDDFMLSEEPAAHLEFVAWSEGAKEETAYTTKLFDFQFRCGAARAKVDERPKTRSVCEAEIRDGRCNDGNPISHTMGLILRRTNWGR